MPKSEIEPSAKDQAFLQKLISDYPQFRFCLNQKRFSFRYAEPSHSNSNSAKSTIFIGPPQPFFTLQTLHELGHALSRHKDYTTHIKRLKIESEAWEVAKMVLEKYQEQAKTDQELAKILPEWNQDYVEDCLDTYRDWLHTKSKCKKCGQTRYQTKDGKYHCPFCETFCN